MNTPPPIPPPAPEKRPLQYAHFEATKNGLHTAGLDRGAVLAVGGHLLTLGGEDGVLRLIQPDPAGYHELHAAKVFDVQPQRNMIWAAMAYSDGYLIIRSQNQLKCIDLRRDRVSAK